MTRLLLAVLLGLALAALPARSDDGPPALTEIRVNGRPRAEVSPGGVIEVRGSGLHACPPLPEPAPGQPPPRNTCRHEELRLSLGDAVCLIVQSTAERLTFIVPPGAPLGPSRVVIRIRGRGEAALDLEVTEALPNLPGGGAAAPADLLRITRFVEDEGVFTIVVSTTFPEGLVLEIVLDHWPSPVATQRVRVEAGTFRASFGPFRAPPPPGVYRAHVLCELRKQPRAVQRRVHQGLTADELAWLDRLEVSEFLSLRPTDHAGFSREVQALYGRLVEALVQLSAELAVREATPDRATLEDWARARFFPELTAVAEAARAFDDRFAFPPLPRARRRRLDRLCALLGERFVVVAVRVSANEDMLQDVPVPATPTVDPQAAFDRARRQLLDEVGLGKAAAPR
ncbi:MAG: IPT/TIG domain-containing protein [Planctomycetes bacterium]|nr:IPT/TIG domain-containing protein [Planctomycetota bacterium]